MSFWRATFKTYLASLAFMLVLIGLRMVYLVAKDAWWHLHDRGLLWGPVLENALHGHIIRVIATVVFMMAAILMGAIDLRTPALRWMMTVMNGAVAAGCLMLIDEFDVEPLGSISIAIGALLGSFTLTLLAWYYGLIVKRRGLNSP